MVQPLAWPCLLVVLNELLEDVLRVATTGSPAFAKGVVAEAQQPIGDRHVGKLGPILLTAANLHKELAQLLVLERVPGGRLNQDPADPADPARALCGDVDSVSVRISPSSCVGVWRRWSSASSATSITITTPTLSPMSVEPKS